VDKSGWTARATAATRRAATAYALRLVLLAGPLTLSALRKLDAHLEGDRLARSENVLNNW
jgi:hypothetical protein